MQERLIEKYMALPNEIWDSIIVRATAVSFSDLLDRGENIVVLLIGPASASGSRDNQTVRSYPQDECESVHCSGTSICHTGTGWNVCLCGRVSNA